MHGLSRAWRSTGPIRMARIAWLGPFQCVIQAFIVSSHNPMPHCTASCPLCSARWDPATNGPANTMSEDLQARWLDQLYRLWFSYPQIKGIWLWGKCCLESWGWGDGGGEVEGCVCMERGEGRSMLEV